MKKYLFFALTALMVLAAGCSGDNINTTDDEEQKALDAAILENLKTDGIMNALCKIDTLGPGALKYTPRYGAAIEAATPTVFYTIAYDLEYARMTFESIIAPLDTLAEDGQNINEIRQGNIHLTFSEGTTSGEIARIKVDCPELSHVLTDIVFVPEERWPANDNASPFNLLSLWKHKGHYYICVRKADSQKGIMLSFDGGWGEDWFKLYDHWQGQFYLYTNTASADAFDCLLYLIKNRPDRLRTVIDKIREENREVAALWDVLMTDRITTFDRNYNWKSGLWCAYHCYYVSLYKTDISKDKVKHYNKYYEHKETPERSTPSSEIVFDTDYDNKNSSWTCIYKGS